MNGKNFKIAPLMVLIPLILSIVLVNAPPTGSIRVNPSLPVMLESPADFTVDTIGNGVTAYFPHIFLVMTEECFNGLTGDVEVSWTGGSISFAAGDFDDENDNSVKLPPGTTEGAGYTVASLKDHLSTSGPIYWAFGAFLSDPITNTPQAFTVTLPSTSPRMLVYALGKGNNSETAPFDMRTPPTIPGFVVPEPATIIGIASSMTALAGYAIKKRKLI